MLFKIVETDSFGGGYPDEKALNLPPLNPSQAGEIADAINRAICGECARRYWVVKPMDYVLQPGFEP